jgi:hypothetical protein
VRTIVTESSIPRALPEMSSRLLESLAIAIPIVQVRKPSTR